MTEFLSTYPEMLVSITTAVTGLIAALGFLNRRDKIRRVRESFDRVVTSLASTSEVERMAGAILLRRFFDRQTEVGVAGTPYAKEAVDVIGAILRGCPSGTFQKTLADGLAFAPTLERADLQRTNLQFAFLGVRQQPPSPFAREKTIVTNLRNADFFRADLSNATLKGADARGAQFYQACMRGTVLKRANLRDANFFEADLGDALLDGAHLTGATFVGARNLPPGLEDGLDDKDVYIREEAFQAPQANAGTVVRVFVSTPALLTEQQQHRFAVLIEQLRQQGLTPEWLERSYPSSAVLAAIQGALSRCAGAVVCGFRQLHVHDGTWRPDTTDVAAIKDACYATPWNQIEAGMAAAAGLPLLVVHERGVGEGVFALDAGEPHLCRACIDETAGANFERKLAAWCSDVRARSRLHAPDGKSRFSHTRSEPQTA